MKSCPPPLSSIKYEHARDQENFKNGFEDGSLDAREGIFSICAAKKCDMRNPYERGYKLGYKKEVHQNKSMRKGLIDPLIDSPGKTRGSDFNGDGIHDFLVGAPYNDAGGGYSGNAYVFFGATTLSGTKDLLGTFEPDVTVTGTAATDFLGLSVCGGGDAAAPGRKIKIFRV